MNSFNTQLHSDETQAAADYADYQRYLDGEYDTANVELRACEQAEEWDDKFAEDCDEASPYVARV